jgi:hypothetical protein
VPLSAKSYWQFTMSSFSLGSYMLNKNQQAISSTGYTELGMPSSVIMGWLWLVNGTYSNNNYYASCDTTAYPSMMFGIGGKQYEIPPVEFIDHVSSIV